MRLIYFLCLLAFVAAVGIFVFQNNRTETVTFLNQTGELPFPVLMIGTYVLGMLSGWTVVGMLRRTWRHVVTADGRAVRTA
jgi:uncharacterized integral membrane protein